MNFQGKNMLLLCGLALILPACAPSLPMLAIGAAAYVAQTQLSKPEAAEDPPPKAKAAVKQKNSASSSIAEKSSRRLPEHCRRVSSGTECTL